MQLPHRIICFIFCFVSFTRSQFLCTFAVGLHCECNSARYRTRFAYIFPIYFLTWQNENNKIKWETSKRKPFVPRLYDMILCNHCNKKWMCVLTLIVNNVHVIWSISMPKRQIMYDRWCTILIKFVNNKNQRTKTISISPNRIQSHAHTHTYRRTESERSDRQTHIVRYTFMHAHIENQFQLFACSHRLLRRQSFIYLCLRLTICTCFVFVFAVRFIRSHYESISWSRRFVVPLNKIDIK